MIQCANNPPSKTPYIFFLLSKSDKSSFLSWLDVFASFYTKISLFHQNQSAFWAVSGKAFFSLSTLSFTNKSGQTRSSAMRTNPRAPTWPTAVERIWTLFVLTEKRLFLLWVFPITLWFLYTYYYAYNLYSIRMATYRKLLGLFLFDRTIATLRKICIHW